MMNSETIILFPTRTEAEPFVELCGGRMEVHVCGVGLAECAANTAKIIVERAPKLLVLAGIAGAYDGSGLAVGDTVFVGRENSADLGSVRNGKFHPIRACLNFATDPTTGDDGDGDRGIDGTGIFYTAGAEAPGIFPVVDSNSVNTAGTPYIVDNTSPGRLRGAIENMEGAAFFAVCAALGVPCLEIRTVSNIVGAPSGEWNIPLATRRLAEGLMKICMNSINRI